MLDAMISKVGTNNNDSDIVVTEYMTQFAQQITATYLANDY